MAKQWLVKIAAEDDGKDPVLLRVTSKGSESLDLDLIATESTVVFKGKLRKRTVQTLKAKNYRGTEDEWEAILKYALLEGQSSVISDDQKQTLELGTSAKGKEGRKVLSIIFRQRIDDITLRLGAIELPEDDGVEISLFDWAILAMDKYKSVEGELSEISKKAAEDETTIASLQTQLADLVEAKAEHEEQLISKFVLLLNEKKAKIRDQNRILQTSSLHEGRLEYVRGSVDGRRRSYTTSRVSKRPAPDDDSNDDGSQAFETQDDDRRQESENGATDSDQQTTPGSTESGASDSELPIQARKTSARKASPQKAKNSAPTPARKPPLHAPFSEGKSGHNTRSETWKAPERPLEDGEETESDDDEL